MKFIMDILNIMDIIISKKKKLRKQKSVIENYIIMYICVCIKTCMYL